MKTKKDKEKIIKDLTEKFKSAKGFLILNLLNLNTQTQNKLKNLLKEKNSLFQVAKKTLVYKANPDFPFKDEELKFPFGFIWDFEENFPSLSVLKKLKEEGINLEILKGYLWNKIFSQKEIEEIINLPSKEELLTKLIHNLKGQIDKFNFSLSFPLRKLILVLSKIKK